MSILDKIKQALKIDKTDPLQTDEAGVMSMGRVISDHPSNFITPAKMKSIFDDAEAGNIKEQHELFADIEERDSAILANIQTRKRAVLGVDWAIVSPREATPQEDKLRDEIEALFYQFSNLEDLMVDCMDAVGHGFSALEIEWKFNGKQWLPKQFIHRPQSWFLLDEQDNLLLKTPDNPTGEVLRQFGWVVHTHKSRSTQLARNGLFRTLAWLYMFKHYSVHDFAEFLELYGMPIRIGKYGVGTTKEDKQKLLRALASIGHNAAGIMPDSMQIELHNAANASSGANNPFLQMTDWCEKSIARLILGQTLTSGADGKSSTNALGNVHNEVRRDLLISDVKQLAQTFTNQIILPYLLINFPNVDPDRIPYFQFDTKEVEDLSTYADSLPKLVGVGVKIPEKWARDKLGIPEAQEDDELLGVPKETQQKEKQALSVQGCSCGGCLEKTGHALSLRDNKKFDAQQTLDDELNNAFENVDFNKQLEPMVKQFVGVLLACSSYEEASDKLATLYPNLNSSQHFEYLNKALFLSEILGKADDNS
ncbi:DUF935 domain-containing protein [Phocoenobacter skyensis]|uniref:DUF935 family protein n=1 Tax=Phocoenobacter skyensis TaxID=97481 RepID=A0ABT9JL04_9PAST|nr:DUF935 family protein [Pasteurella skyensis]MDP8079525.1 DUF935 family protein [Pasteurella skyensis]MDP8085397.1 DUF935 family protein [Pasteurella skyensis]